MKHIGFLILISCLLTSCGINSIEDCRERGERKTRLLVRELEEIRTYDDLIESRQQLCVIFREFAELIVEVRKFEMRKGAQETQELCESSYLLSNHLREEMSRIYQIEGGRELMEMYQREGLNILIAARVD